MTDNRQVTWLHRKKITQAKKQKDKGHLQDLPRWVFSQRQNHFLMDQESIAFEIIDSSNPCLREYLAELNIDIAIISPDCQLTRKPINRDFHYIRLTDSTLRFIFSHRPEIIFYWEENLPPIKTTWNTTRRGVERLYYGQQQYLTNNDFPKPGHSWDELRRVGEVFRADAVRSRKLKATLKQSDNQHPNIKAFLNINIAVYYEMHSQLIHGSVTLMQYEQLCLRAREYYEEALSLLDDSPSELRIIIETKLKHLPNEGWLAEQYKLSSNCFRGDKSTLDFARKVIQKRPYPTLGQALDEFWRQRLPEVRDELVTPLIALAREQLAIVETEPASYVTPASSQWLCLFAEPQLPEESETLSLVYTAELEQTQSPATSSSA